MFPSNFRNVLSTITLKELPSKTYKMQIEEEHILNSEIKMSKREELFQACYKAINTERYAFAIYSWNYGIELQDLFGQPIPYVCAVLPDRIKDCLLQDDRVQNVVNFDLQNPSRGTVYCQFEVIPTWSGEPIPMSLSVEV